MDFLVEHTGLALSAAAAELKTVLQSKNTYSSTPKALYIISPQGLYLINPEGIAYHQSEALYIIIAKAMHPYAR